MVDAAVKKVKVGMAAKEVAAAKKVKVDTAEKRGKVNASAAKSKENPRKVGAGAKKAQKDSASQPTRVSGRLKGVVV